MRDAQIKVGSVVQTNERAGDEWCGCLFVVVAVKSWGVEARMGIPFRGITSMRFGWDEIDYIGEAVMVPEYWRRVDH